MLHHLMCGTWTPPGAIFTVQFDDEALTLKLIKKTEIPHDEPISWMTFDVRLRPHAHHNKSDKQLSKTPVILACQKEHIRRGYEEVV